MFYFLMCQHIRDRNEELAEESEPKRPAIQAFPANSARSKRKAYRSPIKSNEKGVVVKGPKSNEGTASQRITEYIAELNNWRGKMLAQIRELIQEAAPSINEEWKWGTPVWSQKGNVLAASAFKDHIKLNFFKGASLEDPKGLFNARLDAKASRAIDYFKGDKIDEAALQEFIRSAVAYNTSGVKKK
jgi:hypothetical protein